MVKHNKTWCLKMFTHVILLYIILQHYSNFREKSSLSEFYLWIVPIFFLSNCHCFFAEFFTYSTYHQIVTLFYWLFGCFRSYTKRSGSWKNDLRAKIWDIAILRFIVTVMVPTWQQFCGHKISAHSWDRYMKPFVKNLAHGSNCGLKPPTYRFDR